MTVKIRMMRLQGSDPAIALPSYATAGAAGADVRANLDHADRATGITLSPGSRALVPTGFAMEIPHGFEAQIRPRSGLALKHGLSIPNSPGTIDADYRGPVGVIVINLGPEDICIQHGDRIAQMIVAPVVQAEFENAAKLGSTERAEGGFGSTGQS